MSIQIAEPKLTGLPVLDTCYSVADLAGYELFPSSWRLVIKENARTSKDIVAFPVIDGEVMRVDFGDPVRASRIERRRFPLRYLLYFAEHLAR